MLKPTELWESRWPTFRRFVVAVDGSRSDVAILGHALALAKVTSASLVLVSVPEATESESFPATMGRYLSLLEEAARGAGVEARSVFGGSGPSRTLLQSVIDEEADLVVVGTHGRGGPERRARVPLGSVTERLLEQSTVPMLVVPVSPAHEAAGAS